MPEKDIILLLVRNAVTTQGRKADAYTVANEDSSVEAFGNAAIANALEFLGGHGIVSDVQPTLTERGIGFAYRIDAGLISELSNDELILRRIEALLDGPKSETASTLADLLARCQPITLNHIYRDDLLASIRELRVCFSNECYIACLALSGKILEICLKQLLIDNGIQFDDRLMIGQLITKYKDSQIELYLDQTLGDLAKIINKSRIPAVHANDKIPVPSREQAIMVIHAVVDTVNRIIVAPK